MRHAKCGKLHILNRLGRRLFSGALAALLTFTSVGVQYPKAAGIPTPIHFEKDTVDALPGAKFSQLRNVPNGMLLIGSYLIYDQYLTDAIYNLAIDSMTTYNQPGMYYKSEMAGGSWINLGDSASLTDLTGRTGTPASASELADIKISVILDTDGKIYTVSAGGQKTEAGSKVFDLQSPYKIMELPEMTPVSLMYDSLISENEISWVNGDISALLDENDNVRINQLYEKIWTARLTGNTMSKDVAGQAAMKTVGDGRNDLTNRMDKALSELYRVYTYYLGIGDRQAMETVMDAMNQADSARRAEMYYMLAFDGAGSVYGYITKREYDKLITKEQWAEQFMIANWGENWRYNDQWGEAIRVTAKNNTRNQSWSSVNYTQMYKDLRTVYKSLGYKVDDKRVNGLQKGDFAQQFFDVLSTYKSPGVSTEELGKTPDIIRTLYATVRENPAYGELNSLTSFTNKISGEKYYSILDIAYDYGWALSQAGDRLADVRYWADRGDYMKAYANYMSLVQRTGTTRTGGKDFTSDGYVVPGSGRLNALLERLETGDDLTDEFKKEYTTDAEYTSALKEAIQSCGDSYYKYANRVTQRDNTVIGGMMYDNMQYILNNAEAAVRSDGIVYVYYDRYIRRYSNLKNIKNDVIVNRSEETELLQSVLINEVEAVYEDALYTGPSANYFDAVSKEQPEEVANNFLDDQKSDLNGRLAEYEFVIAAYVSRLPIGARVSYIDRMINRAEGFRTSIPDTAFAGRANTSVDELIDWLNDLKKKALGGSTGNAELDALESQRAAFEEGYLNAIDNGDFEAAENYKNQLDELNAKIKKIKDGAMDDFINGSGSFASDAAGLLGGTPTALGEEIRKKAAGDIEDGDMSRMGDYISALGDIGDTASLLKLEKMLEEAGAGKDILNRIGDAKKKAADGGLNKKAGRSSAGTPQSGINVNGYGSRTDPAYDKYNDALSKIMGKDFDSMSDLEKMMAALALLKYALANGDSLALKLALLLFAELLESGNPFIYQQYADGKDLEYVNLAAVDRCRDYTGFRYVHKNGSEAMSQTQGSASYLFTVGGASVVKSDGSRDTLSAFAAEQTDKTIDATETVKYPYIVTTDSEHYLKVSGFYIPDTEYAVLVPEDIGALIDSMVEDLEDTL